MSSRGRYFWDKVSKTWVDIDLAPSDMSPDAAKNIFTSDTIEPTRSMIDGKLYTSRSKIEQHYRDHGKICIGNEKFPAPQPRQMPDPEHHVQEAIRQVTWGEAKLSEYDKHRCKIINHNLRNYNYDRR